MSENDDEGEEEKEEKEERRSKENSLKKTLYICEFNQIHPYVLLQRSIKISSNSITRVSRTRKLN
jgi:negative regulator of genetic competence, sporulation and motility